MRHRIHPLCFIFILICLSAQAFSKDVLVLFPVEVSAADADLAGDYGSALQEGLQSRYKVFYGPAVEADLEKEFQKIDCDVERCAQNVAMAFNGELVADASAKKLAGGYSLKVVITNVLTNELVETKTHRCRSCDAFAVMDAFVLMGSGQEANKNNTSVASMHSNSVIANASPSASVGERSQEQIRRVLDGSKGALYSLYARTLRQNPSLQGKVTFELDIQPDGSVSNVQVINSELKNPRLEGRLVLKRKSLSFGPANATVTQFRYMVDFLPF